MSTVVPASLRFAIDVPPEVRVGETVPIILRLENVGARSLDLYLRGRTIAFDVSVRRGDGHAVWQRLAGAIIPAIIQYKALDPGEVLELRTEWDQRTDDGTAVDSGLYTVQGYLPTDAPDPFVTDPVPLHIAAR
jgi:hypothetical protein